MIPRNLSLARLRFADGDLILFGKGKNSLIAFGIGHAAADNKKRLFGVFDHFNCGVDFSFGRDPSVHVPDTLTKEMVGIIERFGFNVLRHCKADRTRFSGVCQHTHSIQASGHQLFGSFNSVPIFADGFKSVVCGCLTACRLFNLL